MKTTTFTTRLEPELKARLEQIAAYEDRSASYLAKEAIRGLVEDREYTAQLVKAGMQDIAAGRSISEADMDSWVAAWAKGENRPFPTAS